MIELPPPDSPYGYFTETLEQLFGESIWKKFCDWHVGQTGMVDEQGRRIVYSHDVRQFLSGGRDLEFSEPAKTLRTMRRFEVETVNGGTIWFDQDEAGGLQIKIRRKDSPLHEQGTVPVREIPKLVGFLEGVWVDAYQKQQIGVLGK